MSSVPIKNFLYFIVDKLNRSKYVQDGIVKTSSPPVPLPQHPKGWKDIVISFGTNQNYWCLNRSFSVPMFFINEGAQILREAIYSGRGYEEELYVRIFKKNEDNGHWELEYHGRIDFSKHVDEPRKGITINTIEGGPLSYLIANDSVNYEIPLAANNLDAWITNIDGVTLFDRYRYSVINQEFVGSGSFIGKRFAVNFPFISNEGDSVGIIQGSQTYEDTGVSIQLYTQNSANYFFSSIRPIQVRITGQIKFNVVVAGPAPTNQALIYFQFRTGPYPTYDNQYTVLGTDVGGINPNTIIYTTTQTVTVNVDVTINLAMDEKLFFIGFIGINGGAANSVTLDLTDMYVEFKTKNPESTTYSMDIITVHKKVVSLMTGGRFQGDSVFFSRPENKRIQWTSTNALQNFAFQVYYGSFDTIVIGSSYYIKLPGTYKQLPSDNQLLLTGATSNNGVYEVLNIGPLLGGFTTIQVKEPVTAATGLSGTITTIPNLKVNYKDFFNDVNCLYNIGMQIRNNVIYIEPKEDINKPDVEIFDIGEIFNFKLKYSDELLCNTGKFGYKSQDYRQRNGIYEFNTTTEFKFPVDTLKRTYDMILKARGDCFGIEFIRSIIFNKPTTDVTGDNQSFIIDTTLLVKTVVGVNFYSVNGTMILPPGISLSIGDQYSIAGSAFNNGTFNVSATGILGGGGQVVFLTGGPAIVNETGATITLTLLSGKTRMVYRPAYTALVGVLDNTVYNTEWSPHKLMLQHGNMLRSLLKEQDPYDITFQTADKNSALSTTLVGVTIAERQNEPVSGLGDPLFMNKYGQFTTPVPLTFSKIISNLGTGYVKGTFYGVPIYFLPIGKMDAKPATNAAQSWQLLLAPNNDPQVLKMLSAEGIFTTDVMGNSIFTTVLNTLHFSRYNYTLPAKYQHKDMYDAQFQDRKDQYISDSSYYQKIQKTDSIFIQAITKGMGVLDIEVYDRDGHLKSTNPMVITSDPAVQLPYIRNDYTIDASLLAEGVYCVIISCNGVKLRVSEWFDLQQIHEGTLLFEYSHTTNKYYTYFTGVTPMIRVEARLLAWSSDADFETYTDEFANDEVLDGIPYQKRKLRILPVPDWMDNKLNSILLLNRTKIDGTYYSRTPNEKKDTKEFGGHDMKTHLYDIRRSKNDLGLSTDDGGAGGSTDDLTAIWTMDGKAWGLGDGSDLQIETEP